MYALFAPDLESSVEPIAAHNPPVYGWASDDAPNFSDISVTTISWGAVRYE